MARPQRGLALGPPRVPQGAASLDDKVARFRVLRAIYHGLLPEDLTDLAARRVRPAPGPRGASRRERVGFSSSGRAEEGARASARSCPGEAVLYVSHPDVYVVVACLKYGPVRQAFEDAALEELAGDLTRTPQKLARGRGSANPESEGKERRERQQSRGSSPAPPAALQPARLFRMFLGMLDRLQGRERQIADWTQNYGRGRGQQPWGWLVRWNVVERCEERDRGARRLGGTHYRPRTAGDAAGGLAGLAALVPVLWACQLRPRGAQQP